MKYQRCKRVKQTERATKARYDEKQQELKEITKDGK